MKLTDYPLLADENIDPEVTAYLRSIGFDVLAVLEQNLQSKSDEHLLNLAVSHGRVIFTHDSDFGTLAIRQNHPVIGIVYLRPGHIDSQFTIESIKVLMKQGLDLPSSSLIAVRRTGVDVTVRLRDLAT